MLLSIHNEDASTPTPLTAEDRKDQADTVGETGRIDLLVNIKPRQNDTKGQIPTQKV